MIQSDELGTRSMTQPYPRDMIGYGRHPLDPKHGDGTGKPDLSPSAMISISVRPMTG